MQAVPGGLGQREWRRSSAQGPPLLGGIARVRWQENIKRCVCLVHDPERSAKRGGLALKAVKLTQPFMDLQRSNNFTGEK